CLKCASLLTTVCCGGGSIRAFRSGGRRRKQRSREFKPQAEDGEQHWRSQWHPARFAIGGSRASNHSVRLQRCRHALRRLRACHLKSTTVAISSRSEFLRIQARRRVAQATRLKIVTGSEINTSAAGSGMLGTPLDEPAAAPEPLAEVP